MRFAKVSEKHEERDVNHFHFEVRSVKQQPATQSRLQSIHRIMFADSGSCQSGIKAASALHTFFKEERKTTKSHKWALMILSLFTIITIPDEYDVAHTTTQSES